MAEAEIGYRTVDGVPRSPSLPRRPCVKHQRDQRDPFDLYDPSSLAREESHGVSTATLISFKLGLPCDDQKQRSDVGCCRRGGGGGGLRRRGIARGPRRASDSTEGLCQGFVVVTVLVVVVVVAVFVFDSRESSSAETFQELP